MLGKVSKSQNTHQCCFEITAFIKMALKIFKLYKCKESKGENIFVEIGSQLVPEHLLNLCIKHGPFDLIIDDGGHTRDMIATALSVLFPNDECMNRDGLYVAEDLHVLAMTWGEGYSKGQTDIPKLVAGIFHKMNFYSMSEEEKKKRKMLQEDRRWADRLDSISLYDSMMFLHRKKGSGEGKIKRAIQEVYNRDGVNKNWDGEPFLYRNILADENWIKETRSRENMTNPADEE